MFFLKEGIKFRLGSPYCLENSRHVWNFGQKTQMSRKKFKCLEFWHPPKRHETHKFDFETEIEKSKTNSK